MTDQVIVSGYQSNYVGFRAPSGQWSVELDAYLVGLNASFGFNLTPHRFSLSFIPTAFNGGSGNLPAVGTYTTMEIRPGACKKGFFLAGNITHADYENSNNGTAVAINVEDRRLDILNQVKVTTEDLGVGVPSGIVSVGGYYREVFGFKSGGKVSDLKVKEYRNITEIGASYEQIYAALVHGYNNNNIAINPSSVLPSPTVIAANLNESVEPLRFKFLGAPLAEVISTVCNDASYDWYWGLEDDAIKIVNRRSQFLVTEDSHPLQSLSPNSVDFRYGSDEVTLPGRLRVFGANQEGVLNSRLLSPIDGVDEPPDASFIFTPAWTGISVSFWDAFGIYRSYRPTEKELQMALKSIEHWAYYKQNQSSVFNDGTDDGVTAAQHPTFQSRLDPNMPLSEFYNNSQSGLRIIDNRNTDERYWVLEWYSRISNHANNHYGRTYVLEGFEFNTSGEYRLVDAAWCNLENQRADTNEKFGENYVVNNLYAPITPFVTQDFKVSPHVVMPSSTVYGIEGLSSPGAFSDWNEDAAPSGDQTYEHYIPVELKRVGQKIIDPRDPTNAFEDFQEGSIIAQFPIVLGSGTIIDSVLTNLVTLYELGQQRASSGVFDIEDPTRLILAYSGISGVAIPVQIRNRYGQNYPEPWVSGTGSGTRDVLTVDDKFAPWNYFPIGDSTSVQIMNQRVSGYLDSQVIEVEEARFADITKTDWPFVGFDAFANQSPVSGVYGTRDHGVTDISVTVTDGVPTTKYGVKSYFSEFGREAPLGERNVGILNSIIHPIDFTLFDTTRPRSSLPDPRRIGPGDRGPITIPPVGIRKEVYAVTITDVFNRGSTTEPERYYSQNKDGIPKPGGAIDPLDPLDLICRDGFFNVGDHGLYIVEYDANGRRRRYYTGGTDLTVGAFVVEVDSVDVGAGDMTITYRGFSIPKVKPIPGVSINNVNVGDAGSLQTDGTARPSNEGVVTGLRPEVDAPAGTYFLPASAGTSAATPVVINGITGFGTSGATATVQPVAVSGAFIVGSGTETSSVEILPLAAIAQSGDFGILAQNTFGTQFVFIARQQFARFLG